MTKTKTRKEREKKKKGKNLPEEVLIEILAKLPVKSLIRFRCVCKSWYDLIKSPYFIKHYSSTQKNNESILSFRYKRDGHGTVTVLISIVYSKPFRVLSPCLEIPQLGHVIKYCGSCDGLICLSSCEKVVLCNPSMREFKLLDPCYDQVAFDCSAIGLGFDSTTNDYKVVKILLKDSNTPKVSVYNLSTHSWREINHNIQCSVNYIEDFGTLCRGVYHWIARSKEKDFILCFDMITEVFTQIELPDIYHGRGRMKRLNMFNGDLCLLLGTYWDPGLGHEFEEFVSIWVMGQYGVYDSWSKKFSFGYRSASWYPIMLWKNEAYVTEIKGTYRNMRRIRRQLITCDLDTHVTKVLHSHGIEDIQLTIREQGISDTRELMVYQESLISIK